MADKHTPEMYNLHRKRLCAKVAEKGMSSLDDSKLIELYLFGVLPRVDTYPAAHLLLEKFGSIDGVFSAPAEELTTVAGIGDKSASHIVATAEAVNRAVIEALTVYPLDSDMRTAPLVTWLLRREPTDTVLVIALGGDRKYRGHRIIPYNSAECAEECVDSLMTQGGKRFIIVHVHPEGYLKPTPDDIEATSTFENICLCRKVKFDEHYICCAGAVYGIKKYSMEK